MSSKNESTTNISIIGQNSDSKSIIPFEEAMNMTGFGKFNVMTIIFSGTILLGLILETLGLGFVIPASQCDLELTLVQKSWLASIPYTGMILMCNAWGYLTDVYGRRKVSMITMAIGCTLSILSSFSPNFLAFAILRFITNLFVSGSSSIPFAYLGEMNPSKYRDTVVTLANSFVAIATAVVPSLAWLVLPLDFQLKISFLPYVYRPWRLLMSLFAIPFMICSILFYLYFPESPKFLMNKGRSAEALAVLKKIHAVNFGSSKKFEVTEIKYLNENANRVNKKSILKNIWNRAGPLFKRPYLRYTLTCFFLQFCTFAIVNGFYLWFPDLLSNILNGQEFLNDNPTNVCGILKIKKNSTEMILLDNNSSDPKCDDSLHTTTFPITIILSVIVSVFIVGIAFLIKKINKRIVLITIFSISATGALVVTWVTNSIAGVITFSTLQICETCIGVINAFVAEIFPTKFRALAGSIVVMAGYLGSILGTSTLGYLVNTNCDISFFLFAGFIYCTVVLCFLLPRKAVKSDTEF